MVANSVLRGVLELVNHFIPPEEALPSSSLLASQVPRKVLVIASRFIGDCILLTPFIRNLFQNMRLAHPQGESQIDLVATPLTANLFENLPGIDRVLIEGRDIEPSLQVFLEAQQYDTMFLCRYAPFWESAGHQTGVSQRIGFDLERLGIPGLKRRGRWLTHVVQSGSIYDTRPQVEIYLDMLRTLQMNVRETHLECFLTKVDIARASQLLENRPQRPRILIHATAASPGKAWGTEQWSSLLQRLPEPATVIASGGEGDRQFYDALSADSGATLLNLCGLTTLRESMALMAQVDMVITLDTAVAHMAAAVGVPRLIVLYGPTNHEQWIPWVRPETVLKQVTLGLPCQPCMARTCLTKRCLRQLPVEIVHQAVEQSFEEKPLG